MKRLALLLITFLIFHPSCKSPQRVLSLSGINPWQYNIQKEAKGRRGTVVSAHPLASAVGLSILKQGGNAIDAAIATQLALAVVYPGAGNIGGGGFMVAHLSDGKNISIDFREKAPGHSSRDMYIDSAGNARTDWSQHGRLSSGVPGTVAGIFKAFQYGKLPFPKLIDPAIELAEHGFAITESEARSLNNNRKAFIRSSSSMPAFVRDRPWKAGDTLLQTDLANTLKRIRDKGAAGFYKGETARLIAREMKKGNGIITEEDLNEYQAVERVVDPFSYRGYTVLTMPLPSSGGILLPQMLKMVEPYPLAEMGFHTLRSTQLMIEVERRAYADRAQYLGDPDYFKVPVQSLTDSTYLRNRMADYIPGKAGNSKLVQPGVVAESEETTHLCVLDENGNAVAVTTTLNGGYGSHVVVAGAGFLMNNEMDDFSIKPGVPNMYGAVGGEANAIRPGKRMLSSMTPTIVLRNGKVYLITGTPGGTTIITSVFQTLVNVIDFRLNADNAVNQPKFHMQWLPDTVFVEKDFPKSVADSLQAIGYKIVQRGGIGRTELIMVFPDGNFDAVGDHRGEDDAEGY